MLDKAKPLLLLAGTLSPLRPGLHRYTRRKVTSGYQFLEGPVWSKDGYLLFSDVPASKVLRIDENGIKPFRTPSGKTNGNTIDALGRVLSCESEGRRVVRQDKKGNWEVLADKWEGKRLYAPNDIVVRKDGHIYFTDPAFGNQADTRELNFYGVYHIPPKGPMELVAKPKGRPNGIAFSPKGNLLYAANTDDRNIVVYDVDKNGKTSNERVFIANIDEITEVSKTRITWPSLPFGRGFLGKPVRSAQAPHQNNIELLETDRNRLCFGL